jgi:hypothetical protein
MEPNSPPMGEIGTWESMRARIGLQLLRQTNRDVEGWREQIAASGISEQAELHSWLTEQGVEGYPRMLLIWETFGYPEFLLASADELIGGQYRDRPALRPIFDAVLESLLQLGDVAVQACKTYVSVLTPRRTFAAIKPSTKHRVDLELRLEAVKPTGVLKSANRVGSDTINVRIGLNCVEDLTPEVLRWAVRAYEENC